MTIAVVTYAENVAHAFERLKAPGYDGAIRLDCGRLVPVSHAHAEDECLVAALARWRTANAFAYPTRFPVTFDGTAEWLRTRVLAAPDRVMFLVEDASGRAVGHAGFADALNDERLLKLDNVMRGEPGPPRGIMSEAVAALLGWAQVTLRPAEIHLPVFVDNEHAIRFYRRLGFLDAGLVPLRRVVQGARVEYVPRRAHDVGPPDRHHLRMIYRAA